MSILFLAGTFALFLVTVAWIVWLGRHRPDVVKKVRREFEELAREIERALEKRGKR